MKNNNDKDFLIQLLNEIELSDGSIDLYLKIIGRSPLTWEEIALIMNTTKKELNKSLIEELLNKGLKLKNIIIWPDFKDGNKCNELINCIE